MSYHIILYSNFPTRFTYQGSHHFFNDQAATTAPPGSPRSRQPATLSGERLACPASINRWFHQPMHLSTIQSSLLSINQSTNQLLNQPINQPINQSIERRSRNKVEAIRARCSVGVMETVRDPPDHAPDSSQGRVKSLSS